MLALLVTGQILSHHALWDDRHERIHTEYTVALEDGTQARVTRPGGAVDGIGMRVLSEPALADGDTVEVAPGGRLIPRAVAVGSGYLRQSTSDGTPLYWSPPCITMTAFPETLAGTPAADTMAQIRAAVMNWMAATQSCATVSLEIAQASPGEMPRAGRDGQSVLYWRQDWPYDRASAGQTTLLFIDDARSGQDGRILEADVELNPFMTWGIAPAPEGCVMDIQNALTHELGHVLGLDHTNDLNATMYPYAPCGETSKRSPEAGDQAGICAAYATSTQTCTSTGCQAALGSGRGPSGGKAVLFLLAASLLIEWRLRRRKR